MDGSTFRPDWLFQRHQLAKVTFVGSSQLETPACGFCRAAHGSWIATEVRTARTGALQRGEAVTAFNGFQAVVDAVAAADWNEAIQNVVKVSCRDFINREVTVVNTPFREIGPTTLSVCLAKVLLFSCMVVFSGSRWLPSVSATIISLLALLCSRWHYRVQPAPDNDRLFHFKGGRAGRCLHRSHGFAIQQHFR
jgi:hypothetical protein